MSYKYYMRENVTGATTYDLETDFQGLRIVRVDGLEKYGEIKNIFEREYVEEQNIDFLYPTTPTFKPTTITIMFGIFERFITNSTTFAAAKDAFLEYIGTKNVIYWDTYRNKRAFMYRDGDIDITEDRRRNGDSFIQVTVKYKNTKGYVDNYDINNLMSFDTTWNVQSISPTITLPFYGVSPNEEVYIDWGDESEVETIAPMTTLDDYTLIQHSYSVFNPETKIRVWSASTTSTSVGKMPVWSFSRIDQSIMDIISADTPMGVCYDGITPNTSFAYIFAGCTNLANVHNNLFKYNTQIKYLNNSFESTSIVILPTLNYCTQIINLSYAFKYTKITEIPEHYFDNLLSLISVEQCFAYCSFLTTYYKYLFRYNLNCTNFSQLFFSCINLKIIEDTFCDSLTEKYTRFLGQYVFFIDTFKRGNSGTPQQGKADDLWNYTCDYVAFSGCFSWAGNNSSTLSNYDDIPSNWGGSATYYQITITQPTGAIIRPVGNANNAIVKNGSNITFNITANDGYNVTAIVTNVGSYPSAATYTFTNVTSNKTLTATTGLLELEIETFANTGGTITASETVYAFTNKTITITPNTKFAIQRVEVDGVNMGAITSYTFTNILSDHTVRAYFQEIIQFKTTWAVPTDNYNLYLPFLNTSNSDVYLTPNEIMYIDWGDGEAIQEFPALTQITALNRKHFYATAGTYQICIWSESSSAINSGKMSEWVGTTLAGIDQRNIFVSIDTPILPMYNGNTVCNSINFFAYGCNYLTNVCDYVIMYLTNLTSAVSAFENCLRLTIGTDLFIDETNEKYTYFANRTIDFTSCFQRSSFHGSDAGIAPSLWDYSGNLTGADCFLGSGNSTLSNINDIPTAWGGSATYYTITITQAIGGYITPTGKNGNIYIKSGETVTVYITPLSGKTINDVIVGGVSQGAITSYEFTNVTANKTITAVFI